MSTKVYPATPTEGETKAPAIATGSADASASSPPVTILKDVFKLPDHIPKDMLTEAVKICQEAKEINKYNHHKGGEASRPDCNHDRVQGWKRDQCADCGADLGTARLAEEDRLAKNAEEEDAKAASSVPHVDRLHGMAVRVDFLIFFAYIFNCWEMPTWQIVRDIVIPLTIATRCRFADLPCFDGTNYFGPADVFMSHCWGSTFGDLIAAACHGARSDRYVWIDIFAVRQWPGNGADLDFRGVIKRCKALVLSMSTVEELKIFQIGELQSSIDAFLASPAGIAAMKTLPTFRLWCIVEIAAAILRGLAVVVKGGRVRTNDNGTTFFYDLKGAYDMMQNLAYMIDLLKSECAVRADYDREMKIVREMKNGNGIQYVNDTVSGAVVGSVLSLQLNVLANDAYMCGEKESFRKLIINVGSEGDERELAEKVLTSAGAGGRLQIVQELLTRWGIDEKKEEEEGETKQNNVFSSSSSSSFVVVHQNPYKLTLEEKVKWVQELIDESLVVWLASSGGHVNVVDLLLNVNNVNVNVVQSECTALYTASFSGHFNVVETLLKRTTIDVNKPTDDGCTPLYIAAQKGHVQIVQTLLTRNDIDVNKPQKDGCTPLYYASCKGHVQIVQTLLTKDDIDVNKPQKDGCTPLYYASCKGHVQIVQTLLTRDDIDVNKPHNDGSTPLWMAAQNGHVQIVQTLLTRDDIDVNKHTKTNQTPLNIASDEGHVEVVRLLLSQPNIDLNKKDDWGTTALGIAKENSHTEVVQLLTEAGAQ